MALCQLPINTVGMTFETFEQRPGTEQAYNAALAIANEEIEWLTLAGPCDQGKTHLAVAAVRRWLDRGRPARYAYVPGCWTTCAPDSAPRLTTLKSGGTSI